MAAKLRKRDGAYWAVVHLFGKRKWKKIGTDKREAQKVVKGTKYAANIWVRQYDYETTNLWGCSGTFT